MPIRTATRAAAVVLYSFFVLPFSLRAQDAPVFRSTTDVVVVPVTVTGRDGRFVRGLTGDQFEIADGGVRRAITQFSADRAPVSLAILLDISGSMATSDANARAIDAARWADTRRALELLVTRLDPRDEVLFGVFADKVALAVSWTREHTQIVRAFDGLQPRGRTSLFDAIKLIAPAFQVAQHQRKVLLLVSDGLDNAIAAGPPMPAKTDAAETQRIQHEMRRTAAAAESKAAVRDSGALLYAIGMGTRKGAPVDVAILERLTVDSGGYVESLRDPADISAAVARICDELQSQYLLGFEPAHADGSFHAIAVKLKKSRLKARARSGYVATKNE
jgi:Ca-activated chloride channel family protein